MNALTAAELFVLALIYAGAGAAFVRAALLRREAVQAWRAALGGSFDKRQHRFATELEIDRAQLPPDAAAKLFQSRRVLVAASLALLIALGLNFFILRPA